MNRPALFATGVVIRDFRGYGSFSLELPASPCAVILSGPNGLGKTSFFEGIEWALTGSVSRLDLVAGGKVSPHDLARRVSGVSSFGVEVSFRDSAGAEERVARQEILSARSSAVEVVGTTSNQVAAILGSGDARWNLTEENLANYLRLTHFHAQAAALRLVTYSAKERWVRVSPLAGVERLDRVRTNLTNSKAALTRIRDGREAELESLLDQQRRWARLVERKHEMELIVGSLRDTTDPGDVLKALADAVANLPQSFVSLVNLVQSKSGSGEQIGVGGASALLQEVRRQGEKIRSGVDTRVDVLSSVAALPQQSRDLSSQRELTETQAQNATAEIAKLQTNVEHATAEKQRMQQRARFSYQEHARASEEYDVLSRALRDRRDIPKCEADLDEAERRLRELESAVENAELSLAATREAISGAAAARERKNVAGNRLAEVEARLVAIDELHALAGVSTVECDKLRGLEAVLEIVVAELAEANAEREAADEEEANVERELERLSSVDAPLRDALALIAAHVRDEDTTCPLCSAVHPETLLRERVMAALKSLSPQLASAESKAAQLRVQRIQAGERVKELSQKKRKVEADVRVVASTLESVRSRESEIRRRARIEEANVEDARIHAGSLKAKWAQLALEAEQDLRLQRAAEDLQKELLDRVASFDQLRVQIEQARERVQQRHDRLQTLNARLRSVATTHPFEDAGDSLEALENTVRRFADLLSGAATALSSATLAEESAGAALYKAQQDLANAVERKRRLSAQANSIDETINSVRRRWGDAGLREPVTESNLQGVVESLSKEKRAIDGIFAELDKLSQSLHRWSQASELNALQEDVRRFSAPHSPRDYARVLDSEIAAARRGVEVAVRARAAADELSRGLSIATSGFGERSLKSFGTLLRRYLTALLHDDRFHEIRATYETNARAAALRFEVAMGPGVTDAECILSEGQLGEVSLAAMLAASSAFPWSRWKALLLDDPTQYNDLIHATSLFDVLRNLIHRGGYQVVLATHDAEQASFFRRKLDGLGVPWVDCRFNAHSPDGILAEVTQSGPESQARRDPAV